MSGIFLCVVNMSIAASWIVLAVLLLRWVLRGAPKWITMLLWGIVAVRLICPISIESAVSLMPSAETIRKEPDMPRPTVDSGLPFVDEPANEYLHGNYFEGVTRPTGHFWDVTTVLSVIWIVGIAALLLYAVISYGKLKRTVDTAVRLRDNIFQSECVSSPFVFGCISPKIYLPFRIKEKDMVHVITHEQAHLRRLDHWWKPFGFLLLTLHWFNPLMWLSFVLFCRDMEFACDEKAVRGFSVEQKALYSEALLSCGVNRRVAAVCPLAFGETGVKARVRSVLRYKKPAFWVIVVSAVLIAVVAVCFLTNPLSEPDRREGLPVELESYSYVRQEETVVTLAVPTERLLEEAYTAQGQVFGEEALVAYRDATTTLYLTEVRRSNEGADNLYFCFDFDFDVPKAQGAFLYPYEIGQTGSTNAVYVTDGVLKADNGEFPQAVHMRGQGPSERIWFYVATDALRRAQGTVRFDVTLNRITYGETEDIATVGGADGPHEVLRMPERIVFPELRWGGDSVTVTFEDRRNVAFTEEYGETKIVPLTEGEYAELEQLFSEVNDFSNLLFTSPNDEDTVIQWNGKEYRCVEIFSTQVELEQFLSKLKSYYFGTEYDWRVEQERGFVRYNERMLPSAHKDMQNWAENESVPEIRHLSPRNDLEAVEALDGNVYRYYGIYGIDYIRGEGDLYYVCYRSEEEILTIWFDRQGTKLRTERRASES